MPRDIYWKDTSKSNWYSTVEESGDLSVDRVATGALMRIADATEKMAVNHNQLMYDLSRAREDRDNYKRLYERAANSNRSLKGVITKLRRK